MCRDESPIPSFSPLDVSCFTAKMKPETQHMLTARQSTAIVMEMPSTPSAIALTMMPAHTSPRGIMPIASASRVRWFTSEPYCVAGKSLPTFIRSEQTNTCSTSMPPETFPEDELESSPSMRCAELSAGSLKMDGIERPTNTMKTAEMHSFTLASEK